MAAVCSHESGDLLCRAKRFVQVAQAFSQSDYGHTYAARMALDGVSGVDSCWVSLPYGGESKENPVDIWLAARLPSKLSLAGLRIVGDPREVVATTDRFDVYLREDGVWKRRA